MTARLDKAPTLLFKTTLDGRLSASDIVATLVSSTGLQAPGVIVINRQDGDGADTHYKMEFILFTGISGRVLTGLTRGVAWRAASDHNSGSLVEAFINVTHWDDFLDFLNVEHTSDGREKVNTHVRMFTMSGVSGATGIKGDLVFVPGSNITIFPTSGVSGYNVINFNFNGGAGGIPPFMVNGGLATLVNATPPLISAKTFNIRSISAVLDGPASGATVVLDVNKNFTTLFTNQATRLMIPAGGTYASTASFAVSSIAPGNIITLDIDNVGIASNLMALLET